MSKLKKALDYSQGLSDIQKLILAVMMSAIVVLTVVFVLSFLNNLLIR